MTHKLKLPGINSCEPLLFHKKTVHRLINNYRDLIKYNGDIDIYQ